jgi:hypothetical protein
MDSLLCNGKGAPYSGRVEFERGLWRSALSLRAKWRRHALLSDGQSNPRKRRRRADSVQAFTNRFDRQIVAKQTLTHKERSCDSRKICHVLENIPSHACSREWPREGRLQNLPAHRPCSLKISAALAAPGSRAVFSGE